MCGKCGSRASWASYAAGILVWCFSSGTIAAPYSITPLGTLGGPTSTALAINNAGQIVGYSDTSSGPHHAFLYSAGTMLDLGTLAGATTSSANAINDGGQIAGTSNQHAFLYSGGSMSPLNDPFDVPPHNSEGDAINSAGVVAGDWAGVAATFSANSWTELNGATGGSRVLSINDAGQMAGWLISNGGAQHAFLYGGGTIHDLGTLGGPSSDATAINASGHVVGSTSRDALLADDGAFFYANGTMQNLGNLGGLARALAINSSDVIVGASQLNNGLPYHAFLYAGGTMQDLNSLIPAASGWTLNVASGINDTGQIAGYGIYQGQTQAFLLTPAPEPTGALALGVVGAGMLLLRRCRESRRRAIKALLRP
jgi:probable HAF family extracellular repeat protein